MQEVQAGIVAVGLGHIEEVTMKEPHPQLGGQEVAEGLVMVHQMAQVLAAAEVL
jgi:hypothetical protein